MIAVIWAFSSSLALAQAQTTQADLLATAYNEAMGHFNRGEWGAATEGLEKVIAMVTDPRDQGKIGPIHYSLGAAYFNEKNYPKAIAAFTTFMQRYAQDPRVAEARLAVARATFLNKDYEGAARLFAAYEAVPAMREQALLVEAACFHALKRPEEQIRILTKLTGTEWKTPAQANSGLELAALLFDQGKHEQVLSLINQLHAHIHLVDNVVALNALTVKLGDYLAEKKGFSQALAAYRAVRSRDQVLAFQADRIAALEKRVQANAEAGRGGAFAQIAATSTNQGLEASLTQAKEFLTGFEKLPDYMPGVYLRMAKVWYDWGKKWETIVVFQRFLELFPKATERELALYSTITCFAELGRTARTQSLCEAYLKEFPQGANANTVGYLLGNSSLESNEPKKAISYFGMVLTAQPNSPFREQMQLGVANSYFAMGDFEQAQKEYDKFIRLYPGGTLLEEAEYRGALTAVSRGEYEAGLKSLNAYVKKYPNGQFLADAGYRIMVCKYAASLYDEVIADAETWESKYAKDTMAGEVYALKGDALAAQDKIREAATAYQTSYERAATDEVLNYSIFEACKHLQKLNEWGEISRMFESFVKAHPEHPTVVAAMFWIGRAKAHEGKVEEAKVFLVEQLKRFINEPKREAVEQLLQQLAQLSLKRPRPTPSAEPPAVVTSAPAAPAPPAGASAPAAAPVPPAATPAPPATAPLPPYDPLAELRRLLLPLQDIANDTGKARLLYAEAELAKLRRQDDVAARIYDRMAAEFKPEVLSPVLLAMVGDRLLQTGERDRAAVIFDDLRQDFPKSDYLDFAYTGLGQIAFDKQDYAQALTLFSLAADEVPALKVREATMGKARALLELKRYDEAKKLFSQAAGMREWRGETTAAAVYYLGEGEARQGHWPEAIAHYQRVFVAYQKYLSWAAKAYLRSAEAFDQMHKRTDAVNHLREMLRNEKLRELPEGQEAQKKLEEWGKAA